MDGVSFPTELVFGAILGIVELVDCTQTSQSPWAMPDHYHWQFANPRSIVTPIDCKGALSLWTPPDEALEEIF